MSEQQMPRVEGQNWVEEPWEYQGHGLNGHQLGVIMAGRYLVCTEFESLRSAELRRAVSCVNALAGTPISDDVEPGAITRELETLREQAVKDRAVIEALRDATVEYRTSDRERRDSQQWEDQARRDAAWARYHAACSRLDAALTAAGYLPTETEGT